GGPTDRSDLGSSEQRHSARVGSRAGRGRDHDEECGASPTGDGLSAGASYLRPALFEAVTSERLSITAECGCVQRVQLERRFGDQHELRYKLAVRDGCAVAASVPDQHAVRLLRLVTILTECDGAFAATLRNKSYFR